MTQPACSEPKIGRRLPGALCGLVVCTLFVGLFGCEAQRRPPSSAHASDAGASQTGAGAVISPAAPRQDHRLRLVSGVGDLAAAAAVVRRRLAAAGIEGGVETEAGGLVLRVPATLTPVQARRLWTPGKFVAAAVDEGAWFYGKRFSALAGAQVSGNLLGDALYHSLTLSAQQAERARALTPSGMRLARMHDALGFRLVPLVEAGALSAECLMAAPTQAQGHWYVSLRLRERDALVFGTLTHARIGKIAAFGLDDEVLSVAVGQAAITTGALMLAETDELSARLIAAVLAHPLRANLVAFAPEQAPGVAAAASVSVPSRMR